MHQDLSLLCSGADQEVVAQAEVSIRTCHLPIEAFILNSLHVLDLNLSLYHSSFLYGSRGICPSVPPSLPGTCTDSPPIHGDR